MKRQQKAPMTRRRREANRQIVAVGARLRGSRPEAPTGRIRSCGASPEVSTTRSSPAVRLPLEIVEMIIARRVLPPCVFLDLLCHPVSYRRYSRRHHTLIDVTQTRRWSLNKRLLWPKPLRSVHRPGLLPFVRKFWVREEILFGIGGVPQVHAEDSKAFWTHFLPTIQFLPHPQAPKGFRRLIGDFV